VNWFEVFVASQMQEQHKQNFYKYTVDNWQQFAACHLRKKMPVTDFLLLCTCEYMHSIKISENLDII